MRESTVAAPGQISVDAGANGGISVNAWSRAETLVRAKVQTWAQDEGEARSLAGQVQVQTAGGNIRANGPDFGRERGYAVSFEVFVPQRTALSLKAHNGGIAISGVNSRIEFETVNGGVALKRLGGNVTGQTTNGGVNVELTGTRWDGEQLDVHTTNGGVSLSLPANYSARLEAGTVNGGFKSDVPISVHGEIGKTVSATLGQGGPPIRVNTTNGGIHLKQQS